MKFTRTLLELLRAKSHTAPVYFFFLSSFFVFLFFFLFFAAPNLSVFVLFIIRYVTDGKESKLDGVEVKIIDINEKLKKLGEDLSLMTATIEQLKDDISNQKVCYFISFQYTCSIYRLLLTLVLLSHDFSAI